jgi:hypothetical protein
MRIALFNSNGLSGKVDLCQKFFTEEILDLIFIVETKLSPGATGYGHSFLNITKNSAATNARGFGYIGGIQGWTSPRLDGLVRVVFEEGDKNGAIVEVGNELIIGIGYFPPEENNQGMTVKMLNFLGEAMSIAGDRSLILLGDFNARLGSINGDHLLNSRGRKLLAWLRSQGSSLSLEQPVSGRFTCFLSWGRGFGITELVLSRNVTVTGYRVFEWKTLGGSDHRPLVIDVGYQPPPHRSFERWNIRALANKDVKDLYIAKLRTLTLEADWIYEQDEVEMIWSTLRSIIEEAATSSCGRLQFRSSSNPVFWTQELVDLLRNIQSEEEAWYETFQRHRIVEDSARNNLIQLNRELRDALRLRRRQLFLEEYDQFDDPQLSSAFLKKLKCKKMRMSRGNCVLDPGKIDRYAMWFGSTFGQASSSSEFATRSLNEQDILTGPLFDVEAVERLLSKSKMGKSTGFDDLFGEFYRYGANTLAPMMTHLFNCIITQHCIPQDWKNTKIVPIFKNKGDPNDITKYRPIALTSFARRLFEKLLQHQLNPFTQQLSQFQAGFREKRNTLQQTLHLLEIQAQNPDLHHIFIDIKTAYDTVNRPRLWWLLLNKHKVPLYMVDTLKALFDHNVSCLVINGVTSNSIPNRRGLLQGSALSPILFNFYINELLDELDSLPRSLKVETHGMFTNHLHFADDGNIHASSIAKLQELITTVESWSRRSDCVISIDKTVYMGPSSLRGWETIYILDRPIGKVPNFEYLGIFINENGIDWERIQGKRCNKARGVISLLAGVGMNATGWPLRASIKAYKAFIRPVMEYGLALTVLKTKEIAVFQSVQNLALRRMLGVPRNGSIAAMHKLTLLESMEQRNLILNATLIGNLHNSVSKRHPTVCLYRRILEFPLTTLVSPINRALKKNPVLNKIHRLPLLFHPLSDDFFVGPIADALPSHLKKDLKIDHLQKVKSGVAGSIQYEQFDKIRDIFQVKNPLAIRITISRWLLGLVAQHQICKLCNVEELSRSHAISCSGVADQLQAWYPEVIGRPRNVNHIDFLLNLYRNAPRDEEFYGRMSEMIGIILIACRGLVQSENGFWRPPDEAGTMGGSVNIASQSRNSNDMADPPSEPSIRPDTFPLGRPPLSPTSRRISRMQRRHLQLGRPISEHFNSSRLSHLTAVPELDPDFEVFQSPPPSLNPRNGIG